MAFDTAFSISSVVESLYEKQSFLYGMLQFVLTLMASSQHRSGTVAEKMRIDDSICSVTPYVYILHLFNKHLRNHLKKKTSIETKKTKSNWS